MAKSKKQCYISVPSHIINTISSSSMDSLLLSPKKHSQNRFFSSSCSWSWKSPKFWLLSLFFFALIGMLKFPFNVDPCFLPQSQELIPNSHSKSLIPTVLNNQLVENVDSAKPPSGDQDGILNQPPAVSGSESGFWKQPDGMGYKPCIEFSPQYRKDSTAIVNGRRKYLLVVVSGGMNQQRNQIVDAVVIARILGAALVVPILLRSRMWRWRTQLNGRRRLFPSWRRA